MGRISPGVACLWNNIVVPKRTLPNPLRIARRSGGWTVCLCAGRPVPSRAEAGDQFPNNHAAGGSQWEPASCEEHSHCWTTVTRRDCCSSVWTLLWIEESDGCSHHSFELGGPEKFNFLELHRDEQSLLLPRFLHTVLKLSFLLNIRRAILVELRHCSAHLMRKRLCDTIGLIQPQISWTNPVSLAVTTVIPRQRASADSSLIYSGEKTRIFCPNLVVAYRWGVVGVSARRSRNFCKTS